MLMCIYMRCVKCFVVNSRASKRPHSNWEYIATVEPSWDDWGKAAAASNVVEGKRSRKSVDRIN